MSFVQQYLEEAGRVVERLDRTAIDAVVGLPSDTRARGGRLFVLGVGGSAARQYDFRVERLTSGSTRVSLSARAAMCSWHIHHHELGGQPWIL